MMLVGVIRDRSSVVKYMTISENISHRTDMQYGGPILEFIPNEANTKNSRSKSLMAFTKE